MSWLFAVNFLVLQWFCVRLERATDESDQSTTYSLFGFVMPLSGWWNDYKYLDRHEIAMILVTIIYLLIATS